MRYSDVFKDIEEAMEKMAEKEIKPTGSSDRWLEQRQEKEAAKQRVQDVALEMYRPLYAVAIYVMRTIAVVTALLVLYGMWSISPWFLIGFTGILMFIFLLVVLISGNKQTPPDWMVAYVKYRAKRHMRKEAKRKQRKVEEQKELEETLL